MECAFCSSHEVAEREITGNDLVFAFPTESPIVSGHVLITPRRHVQYYEELTDAEKGAIETLRYTLRDALKKTFKAEGFNYAWNEEKVGGQSVPHFHLHILPRIEGDAGVHEYEPRKFLYRSASIETRPKSSRDELREVAEVIRSVL